MTTSLLTEYKTNNKAISDFIVIGEYSYSLLLEKDYEEAVALVASEFMGREPTTIAFDLVTEDFPEEARRRNYLAAEISACARLVSTGEMVGVMLSNDLNAPEDGLGNHSPGYQDLQILIDREVEELLEKGIYTKEKGKLNHSANSAIFSEHGKHIALNLMLFQELLAQKRGYIATVGEATSAVSSRIAAHMGFQTVHQTFYEDMILPSTGERFDISKMPLTMFMGEKPSIKYIIKYYAQSARL